MTETEVTSQIPKDQLVDELPAHVWIEPTDRCNTRCRHCGHFYRAFGQDMEMKVFQRIRDQALGSVRSLELLGYGEPLMAKHFREMFDYCTSRGLEIRTVTNGILLRDPALLERLVSHRVVLTLSLDGATKETFEEIRPFIRWERIVELLERIRELRATVGQDSGFELRINFCAMRRTIGDLPELVRLSHRYGVSEINVLPLVLDEEKTEVAEDSLEGRPDLISPPYLEAQRLAARYGVRVTVPPSFHQAILEGGEGRRGLHGRAAYWLRKARLHWWRSRSGELEFLDRSKPVEGRPVAKAGGSWCRLPWTSTYFGANGTVYPCCLETERLGNIVEQDWDEIWNGQAYQNLRRTIHSWNPTEVCRNCGLYTGINGGVQDAYARFFGRYREEFAGLDGDEVVYGEGFHEVEYEGDSPHHRWMGREGTFELPMKTGARFLRVHLIARAPVQDANPGRAVINDGPEEPFDNTCPEIHFPLDHVKGERLKVSLRMENGYRVGEDTREVALAVSGAGWLFS